MKRRPDSGFTLTELLVTIAIIAVVAAITAGAVSSARRAVWEAQCMSNQRQISHALQSFYNDHRVFPTDTLGGSLRESLAEYVPATSSVFRCPCDLDPRALDSYEPYYVRRFSSEGEPLFAMGCPRHKGSSRVAALFADGAVRTLRRARVVINGKRADPMRAEPHTLTTGYAAFDDGSRVDVTDSGEDFQLAIIESFRLGDGKLYTIVKISGDGTAECFASPGSKFEVIAPSAVVGVRGTRFTVTTSSSATRTDVTVTEGTVWLRDTVRGFTVELAAPDTAYRVNESPGCVHCIRHCRGDKHCRRCPAHKNFGKGKGKGNN